MNHITLKLSVAEDSVCCLFKYAARTACHSNDGSIYGVILSGGNILRRDGEQMMQRGNCLKIKSVKEEEGRRCEGEREARSKLLFFSPSAARFRAARGCAMRVGSSTVLAFWLWCHSGRFTVPLGLYTSQPGSQAVCTTRPRRRAKKEKELSSSLACFHCCL